MVPGTQLPPCVPWGPGHTDNMSLRNAFKQGPLPESVGTVDDRGLPSELVLSVTMARPGGIAGRPAAHLRVMRGRLPGARPVTQGLQRRLQGHRPFPPTPVSCPDPGGRPGNTGPCDCRPQSACGQRAGRMGSFSSRLRTHFAFRELHKLHLEVDTARCCPQGPPGSRAAERGAADPPAPHTLEPAESILGTPRVLGEQAAPERQDPAQCRAPTLPVRAGGPALTHTDGGTVPGAAATSPRPHSVPAWARP